VDRGTAVAITAWKGGDNTINAAEAADGIVITVRRSRVQRPGQRRGGDGCCERHLYRDNPAPRGGGRPAGRDGDLDDAAATRPLRPDADPDRGTAVAITGVEGGGLTAADTTHNAAEARDAYVITGTRGRLDRHRQWRGGGGGADGTYTATIPASTADGRWPVCCQRRDRECGGQHGHCDPDADLTARTAVAITGVRGGDNTINAAEAADGIVITGTAEPGSTVLVNDVSRRLCERHLYRDHRSGITN
jgi:hypothetical protein